MMILVFCYFLDDLAVQYVHFRTIFTRRFWNKAAQMLIRIVLQRDLRFITESVPSKVFSVSIIMSNVEAILQLPAPRKLHYILQLEPLFRTMIYKKSTSDGSTAWATVRTNYHTRLNRVEDKNLRAISRIDIRLLYNILYTNKSSKIMILAM